MLDFIRKRAGNWLIKALLLLVAATFALWGGFSFMQEDQTSVISVDGDRIPYTRYRDTYNQLLESYRSVLGGSLDAKAITDLKIRETAVDYLLEQALLARVAEELRLSASTEEARRVIRTAPNFAEQGAFSQGLFQDFLSRNGYTAEGYEASLAGDLTLNKMRSLVKTPAVVSPRELEELLEMSSRKVVTEVARFEPDLFVRQAAAPTDAEMASWFEEHLEDFRRPETFQPVVAVVDPALLRSRVSVTDDEVAALFNQKEGDLLEPAAFRYSRILFALSAAAPTESVAQAREKAEGVVQAIREGKTAFAAAARLHSADRASAARGGEMPPAAANALDPALAEALGKAEPGKVADPVPTSRGFEVVLLQERREARPLTLAEAKPSLLDTLLKAKVAEEADTLANQLLAAAVKEKRSLDTVAREKGVQVLAPAPFTRKSVPAGLSLPAALLDDVFRAEKGEVGDVYEDSGKLWLFQMAQRTDSRLPKLAEAREEVKAAVLVRKAMEMAGREAERRAQQVNGGMPFATAAAQAGAKVTIFPAVSLVESSLGELPEADASAIIRAAFTVRRAGQAAVAKGRGSYFLVGVREVRPANAGEMAQLRSSVDRLLRGQLEQSLSRHFFQATREEKKDSIKINEKLL